MSEGGSSDGCGFFFQAEDGIRDLVRSRGLGDVYKRQVMLAPATGFYSTPGLGKNEVRIAYVLNKNDINKAMDCLDAALKVYPGRVVARVMSSEV